MNLLIFNCGSSSLSYSLYMLKTARSLETIASGKAYHVATKSQEPAYILHKAQGTSTRMEHPFPNHAIAAAEVLKHLAEINAEIDAVGHRFVHGGTYFQGPTVLDDEAIANLRKCLPLAPIHNPNSMAVVEACQQALPGIPQYASFDTAFHAVLPEKAYRYALPQDWTELGFRKYGFHGLSYQSVTASVAEFLDIPLASLKMVLCHLGTGGSSVAAVDGGRSVETSMGYSPLPGLIMSTRCGDLDPTIPLALVGQYGLAPEVVERRLNKESGLLGVSGVSSDVFELVELAEKGHARAQLAVDMYVHRLKGIIGAYLAILGGADVLAFTDDVGQRCPAIRMRTCAGLEPLGLELDPALNLQTRPDATVRVSKLESACEILVVPTDEAAVIAKEGADLFT